MVRAIGFAIAVAATAETAAYGLVILLVLAHLI